MLFDHTNYAVSETEGDHTLIASDDFIKSDVILGSKKIEVSINGSQHCQSHSSYQVLDTFMAKY